MSNKGRIVVVSGPSGVGKSTVVATLFSRGPKNLIKSISATTRSKRPGEIDGVHYYFWTRQRFEEAIANNELLEYARIYDNIYGTPREPVVKALESGKNVLLEIDVQGAASVRKLGLDALYVFILPPSLDDLCTRLQKRNTPPAELEKRFKAAQEEMSHKDQYDIHIVNDTVSNAVSRLEQELRRVGILKDS